MPKGCTEATRPGEEEELHGLTQLQGSLSPSALGEKSVPCVRRGAVPSCQRDGETQGQGPQAGQGEPGGLDRGTPRDASQATALAASAEAAEVAPATKDKENGALGRKHPEHKDCPRPALKHGDKKPHAQRGPAQAALQHPPGRSTSWLGQLTGVILALALCRGRMNLSVQKSHLISGSESSLQPCPARPLCSTLHLGVPVASHLELTFP